MRIGISTPVVVQTPGGHAPWERGAGIDEIALVAEAADRLGYHHLTCSEHVAVPVDVTEQRGGTYWDPLATLGFVAARTSRIRLATHALVLGYHHPLAIAKRYGTLDRVSGGRLTLGVGVGTLQEEFELLGAPFADRGARADDALAAIRASMSSRTPRYAGDHYAFGDMVVEPHALQERVPIWVGGRTARSLRRAASFDGWAPFGIPLDQITAMIARVDLAAGFDVVLGPDRPLDPLGDPDGACLALERVAAAGATVVNTRVRSQSAAHFVEQLAALREHGDDWQLDFEPTDA